MAGNTPRISVLMAVYNCADFVSESIESILRQSFTDFEFIIVDDGSTDETPTVISRFNDSRIKLVRSDHKGLTSALNLGLAACRGDFIARMDGDDISEPTRFSVQVEYFRTHPHVFILCSDVLTIDERGSIVGSVEMKGVTSELVRDGLLYRRLIKPIVHPTVMMRRVVIERLGGYRDFPCAEDHDFWLRAVDTFDIRRINHFLLKYRMSNAGVSRSQAVTQSTSACMSVVNYYVRASTGIDLFEDARELFDKLRDHIAQRLERSVTPALVCFSHARSCISRGQLLRGFRVLAAGTVRHGILLLPALNVHARAALAREVTGEAERLLRVFRSTAD